MRSYVQPSFAKPSAPYWLMPTPWPQPRPLATNVVAVTGASAGAGARGPAGAEAATARARPMRAKIVRRMPVTPAAEASGRDLLLLASLPNLQVMQGVFGRNR